MPALITPIIVILTFSASCTFQKTKIGKTAKDRSVNAL